MSNSNGVRVIELQVPEALVGDRLDRAVALLTELSRRQVLDLLAEGRILLDGVIPAKPSIKLALGSDLHIEVPEIDNTIQPDSALGQQLADEMVYVDDFMVVVNKPAGVVVHPGAGVSTGTLIQGLAAIFPQLLDETLLDALGGDPLRPGVVHRLDRGTSGLLMVALHPKAFASLSGQLASRTVLRRYLALVDGDLGSDKGMIDGPLGRSERDATRRGVVIGGKEAITHYEVLKRLDAAVDPERLDAAVDPERLDAAVDPAQSLYCLLACRLETGRTHQIRAHLEAIGHPVSGDDRYGSLSGPVLGLDRPFLHAETLGFIHPESGESMSFRAPLPTDLDSILKELKTTAA